MEVIDEKVQDGKMLKGLINHVSDSSSSDEPNIIKIKSLLADGAYDSTTNFQYLEDKNLNIV